jgi:inorganic triphosphatase YgiF
MSEHLEIEQKFDVDAGFTLPSFDGLAGVTADAPVLHHLSATYFDTPDQRLAASKITLRRRTGGTDEGWHLKLPAGAGRREVHAPLGTAGRQVPEELAARVAGVTEGQPLAPIAVLATERTVVTLHDDDGHVLAEVADDSVTASRLPAEGEPLRWREVEVEVPEPAPELQQAAADLLFASGARPAGHGSKLARVLES